MPLDLRSCIWLYNCSERYMVSTRTFFKSTSDVSLSYVTLKFDSSFSKMYWRRNSLLFSSFFLSLSSVALSFIIVTTGFLFYSFESVNDLPFFSFALSSLASATFRTNSNSPSFWFLSMFLWSYNYALRYLSRYSFRRLLSWKSCLSLVSISVVSSWSEAHGLWRCFGMELDILATINYCLSISVAFSWINSDRLRGSDFHSETLSCKLLSVMSC